MFSVAGFGSEYNGKSGTREKKLREARSGYWVSSSSSA
ncbi:hypothetical protein B4113_3443 [Geobacillus sp. B4113_201601]|nr:hypothetical protein B4113_3443 [Geobacillus sp. B4113_201601]